MKKYSNAYQQSTIKTKGIYNPIFLQYNFHALNMK